MAGEDVDRRRAEKVRNEQVCRVVIDILRFADLLHHAGLHNDNHVGNGHGFFLVVRDENGGNLRFLLDAADFLARLQAQAGVKVGQRLVQQQDAGHLHQRAGDSDALLLTAGKLAGLALQQFFNLHQSGGLMRTLQHGFLGHLVLAAEVLQREEDVLLDRQMGIERVILEHQTNATVFRGQIGHIVLPEEDFAAGWLLQTANHVQRRAFAAAGRAKKTNQLSIRDGKVKIVDCYHFFAGLFVAAREDFGQVLQNDFHRIPFLCPLSS